MKIKSVGKSNIIWNTIGTIFATLVSVVLLMIVSRFSSPEVADVFSFSFTVAQQLYVIGLFGVRQFQSTDVSEKNSFLEYFLSRVLTVILMVVTLFFYIRFTNVPNIYILPIIFLTIYRIFDSFSDIFQGLFQQHNRSDLAGKVLFSHSLLTILFFSISLIIFKNINISLFIILLINFILLVQHDKYYLNKYFLTKNTIISQINMKNVFDILLSCLPIFINTFLVNYIYSEPKFIIPAILQDVVGFEGLQRDFNIIFMPSFVLTLLVYILRPLLTELSNLLNKRDMSSYSKGVSRLFVYIFVFNIFVLLAGYTCGIPILSVIFGVELNQYKIPFMLLLIGGSLNVYSVLIDNLLTIHRKQSHMLMVTILTFFVSKLITSPLIENYEILGASISFLITMLVYVLLSFSMYLFVVKRTKIVL